MRLYSIAATILYVNGEVFLRAREFQDSGVRIFDSMHLALADVYRQDILLTTDYRLIRKAAALKVKIPVKNPADWFEEVRKNEFSYQ
jgi:predicted nucleic acid-binding protein